MFQNSNVNSVISSKDNTLAETVRIRHGLKAYVFYVTYFVEHISYLFMYVFFRCRNYTFY